MSRRNKRSRAAQQALQDLGDDYSFSADPVENERRAESRKVRAEQAQARARERHRVDWTRCIIPGCNFTTTKTLHGGTRADDVHFPMCWTHMVVAWEFINEQLDNPDVTAISEALRARREQIRLERERDDADVADSVRAAAKAGTLDGEIYFVRTGSGLVKVGWTSDLESRLRAYGPATELLALYPGTRNDETTHAPATQAESSQRPRVVSR